MIIMSLGMKWGSITQLSKWTTAVQLVFIGLLCISHEISWLLPNELYGIFLAAICCMSMGALLQYGYIALRGALNNISGIN